MESQSSTPDEAQKRERSTIGFPYMDLKAAVALAVAIHSNVGSGHCDDDQLAAWSHQSPKSSSFRVQVSTAKMFGLLSGDGSSNTLTELGRQVVDPKQERAAKANAFLMVPLYRALFDKYKGSIIPPSAGLEADMVQLGVAQKQKDKARQAFERSAEQAGFFESGRNRLVKPAVANGQVSPEEVDGGKGEPPPLQNPSIPASAHSDPLIAALIQKLPPEGNWPVDQRVAWLNLMKMAFQVCYGAQPEIDIKVMPPQQHQTSKAEP